jgi:hypothetical protein
MPPIGFVAAAGAGVRRLRSREVRKVPRAVKEKNPPVHLALGKSLLFRSFALTTVDEAVAKLECWVTAMDRAINTII